MRRNVLIGLSPCRTGDAVVTSKCDACSLPPRSCVHPWCHWASPRESMDCPPPNDALAPQLGRLCPSRPTSSPAKRSRWWSWNADPRPQASRPAPARGSQVPGPGAMDMIRKRSRPGRSHGHTRPRAPRRWVKDVTTSSTMRPPGLFTRDGAFIARTLASPRVSPKGLVSGLRMPSFFINRAGRQLLPSRRAELEKAKRLMQQGIAAWRAKRVAP
jgi:Protein of unknown function (DUF3175)